MTPYLVGPTCFLDALQGATVLKFQSLSIYDSVKMTKKRRNRGRSKHGRGHVNRVRCESSGAMVPKDKAIKRYIVRNIVDASALRDMQDACVIDSELAAVGIDRYSAQNFGP